MSDVLIFFDASLREIFQQLPFASNTNILSKCSVPVSQISDYTERGKSLKIFHTSY